MHEVVPIAALARDEQQRQLSLPGYVPINSWASRRATSATSARSVCIAVTPNGLVICRAISSRP